MARRLDPKRTSTLALPAKDPGRDWYAVRVRSNHESIAAASLEAKGVATYLPAVDVPSVRTDRRVMLSRPIFPGYFFVQTVLGRADRIEVLKAPGVVEILGSATGPIAVPEWEISSIHLALAARNPFEILYDLVPGKRVRVTTGALKGVEGVLMTAPDGKSRIAVSIELLGRTVAFQLTATEVEPA